ncbi:hypothetical protein [Streptomyces sp. NPDC014894]|uniref:hypothetical protein n=1 Tax=unclassified Streptomyces TaxID=2593676 RepID=UPI0036FDCD4B
MFHETWIAGVRGHFPGEPGPGCATPWEERPQWEREAAVAVYEQVREFLRASGGSAARLTREQKGRYVALCWIAQTYRRLGEPKPGQVADWADLPEWRRQTDSDLFEAVEKSVPEPIDPGAR